MTTQTLPTTASHSQKNPIAGSSPSDQGPPTPFDTEVATALANRYLQILNDASIALLTSVGHKTGLFELLAANPGSTSHDLAALGDLHERYVREWLAGMVVAGVVEYDPVHATHVLPPEHAAVLTSAAGPNNVAHIMQYIPMMGGVEDKIVERFRLGGGLTYADYPDFHRTMAEESASVNDASLVDEILPLADGLPGRLADGIDVADIGCGSGHAINLMGQAYPASRFVGYDFSEPAITAARQEAAAMGLTNVSFEQLDVSSLEVTDGFDAITAFDAIHDQAHPARVLDNIRRALRPGGVFLMVDIRAASAVQDNMGLPWASYLYAISMFHCMSVSLGLDGDGLGTAWGQELAIRMLEGAGFSHVTVHEVETDPFNLYYVSRP